MVTMLPVTNLLGLAKMMKWMSKLDTISSHKVENTYTHTHTHTHTVSTTCTVYWRCQIILDHSFTEALKSTDRRRLIRPKFIFVQRRFLSL